MAEKTIDTSKALVVFYNKDRALAEAEKLQGNNVHVMALCIIGAKYPVGYMVWPEGQICPCCGHQEGD